MSSPKSRSQVAISTLMLAKSLYGAEQANVGLHEVASVELVTAKALCGLTRTWRRRCCAQYCHRGTRGHQVSLVWSVQHSCLLWVPRQAQTPRAEQVLEEAMVGADRLPPL